MRKLLLLTLCTGAGLLAQDAANPLSAHAKSLYGIAKGNITKAADKMPEEHYAFKPSADVRSFGQLVGHVADANYLFCSTAMGEKAPVSGIEMGKTTKAELSAALKESFAYCDKAYDSMTDAEGVKMVKLFGAERPKLGVLDFNNMHDYEHYGNMVTYLRIKGLVPPSSEGRR